MVKASSLLVITLVVIVAGVAAYFLLFAAPPTNAQDKSVTLTLSEVREGEEAWVPSTIYLEKGDTVQLTIINGDDEFNHSLSVPELGIQTEMIPPGNERIIIKFTADREGTFLFNDPETKLDCKSPPPEEVSRRDFAFRLENMVENLNETKSVSEAKPIIDQIKSLVNEYKDIVPPGIVQLVAALENATTIEEIASLTEELDGALDAFVESLAPPCIKSGQIIIQP